MLVKLINAPGETADHYISVDTITEVKVYNDTNTISYTTTACDTYSEHFSSRDALDARFEEVQSWFTTATPAAQHSELVVDSMRSCNGYNSPACEHNCSAYDCSGCQFESPTKRLVDMFMQLPDTLKAQFIDEALSHQCITEDEFSLLMGTLPEEDPVQFTGTDTINTSSDEAFFKSVATLNVSILQSTILPNAWKVSTEVQTTNDATRNVEHRLLTYKKADVDFVNSIIKDGLNQFAGTAAETIDDIVVNELNIPLND